MTDQEILASIKKVFPDLEIVQEDGVWTWWHDGLSPNPELVDFANPVEAIAHFAAYAAEAYDHL